MYEERPFCDTISFETSAFAWRRPRLSSTASSPLPLPSSAIAALVVYLEHDLVAPFEHAGAVIVVDEQNRFAVNHNTRNLYSRERVSSNTRICESTFREKTDDHMVWSLASRSGAGSLGRFGP